MRETPAIDPRPDTSGEALQALRGDFLYFNVAGSGPTFPVAQRAAEAFRVWLNEVAMFSHVGYAAYNGALSATRADFAAAIGDPDGVAHVALAQSATEGLNALIAGMRLRPQALVVTTDQEHGSALMPTRLRVTRGDTVRVLPHSGDDPAFLDRLDRELAAGAEALVMSLVSCKSGNLLPVVEACRRARAAGALVIVDAAQALGQVPVDVRELGSDAVVTLGHKWLHGPLATGAFWVRDPERFDPLRQGWRSRVEVEAKDGSELNPDASRFETGTVDVASFVGLRQTLVVHRALGAWVGQRIRALRARLIERLRELPFELVSRPNDPTGIVVVEPRGDDVPGIVDRMWREERIVVKLLHEQGRRDRIRLSFWALHQEKDIDRLAEAFARQLAVKA